jgi:hypothetical protein
MLLSTLKCHSNLANLQGALTDRLATLDIQRPNEFISARHIM